MGLSAIFCTQVLTKSTKMEKSVKVSTLIICILSVLFFTSTLLLINRQKKVINLNEHYSQSVILNYRMLEAEQRFKAEERWFKKQSILLDSLVKTHQKEANFIYSATFAQAIDKFSNDKYSLGGRN